VHAYVAEKVGTVAVLRCVGATSGQTLGIYLLEAAALGLFGAAAGALLGVGVQFALPAVLGDFVPVDVALRLEPRAILAGLGVGVWVAVIFAAPPLLAVRRISPLQTLRREVAHEDAPGFDPLRIVAALALSASVLGIVALRAGNAREAIAMSLAIGVAVLVLWVAAIVLSAVARRMLRDGWSFTVRQGVANLYRPANQTRAVILSLGFGAFLISTLFLVQANLLRQLTLSGEATRANMAFFDVQEDQVEPLDSLIREAGQPVLQRVPIIPMRVASVNGRDVNEMARDRSSWALRREYRSSYRDSLVSSERLVAGRWFGDRDQRGTTSPHEISIEREVAGELGVGLGDTIVWDVQGVRIASLITSIREVNWARFEPNFFIVFTAEALRGAPQSWVFLTHSDDATGRARLQHAAVTRFPNVSSIDLSLIQQAVGGILDRVTVAVRFMALFSIVTGALVLFSSVSATRRQRLREGVLLKTLGATRAQIARIMLSEYALLGMLGSMTGVLLAIGGAWALMRFVFESSFAPAPVPLALLASGMALLTLLIGLLGSRDVFAETPMTALREG
jgi:putative ABC transport system permease protein